MQNHNIIQSSQLLEISHGNRAGLKFYVVIVKPTSFPQGQETLKADLNTVEFKANSFHFPTALPARHR